MPRLIVLTLPIIVLWLAFRAGEQGEGRSSAGELEASSRVERAWGTQAGGVPSSLKRAGLSGGIEKRRVEDSEDPVAEVWEALSPELLVQLSEEDRSLLRSYISDLVSPTGREPHWLCWAPDVSEAKAMAFHEAEQLTGFVQSEISLFANQFLGVGRWNRTATNGNTNRVQGLPTVLTWSVVPDGTSSPGINGQANSSSDFRAWMESIYGGSTSGPAEDEFWFQIIEGAFAAMSETSGVTMRYEPNDDGASISSNNAGVLGLRGDIRIAARTLDGDSGTLAFAFAPDNGDMVFDSADSSFDNTSSSSLRFFNVLAHELGHSLGLDHVCPLDRTKLLEPILATGFRGPQFDEYQSLQRQYGDRLEASDTASNNDSVNNATELALFLGQDLSIPRLSIDDNTDDDFFRIDILGGQSLTVELSPGEGTYLEGAQESDGSCSAGSDFNSDEIHDLELEIIGPNGSTVIASADNGGRGESEFLNQIQLLDDGPYFVRVSGGTDNADFS